MELHQLTINLDLNITLLRKMAMKTSTNGNNESSHVTSMQLEGVPNGVIKIIDPLR